MAIFSDLADLPEDDRIAIIGRAAEAGNKVAFIVEDDAKADSYMKKLVSRFRVEAVKRLDGPITNRTITVIVIGGHLLAQRN